MRASAIFKWLRSARPGVSSRLMLAAMIMGIPPSHAGTPAATTTTLSSAVNPSLYGQSVQLSATVSAASGTPAGRVVFDNGTRALGTATLVAGVANLAVATLPAGTAAITAVYKGNAAFAASTSTLLTQVVEQTVTSTSLVSSPSPSADGQAVRLTATVSSPAATPAGSVIFENGTKALGTVVLAGGVASLAITTLAVGTASVTAAYKGSAAFAASTSAPVSQAVKQATSTLVLSSLPNPSTVGQSVTFTATVKPQFSGAPTGNVAFANGGASLGSATMKNGVATFSTASLPTGTLPINAAFPGGENFSASSATVVQAVYPVGYISYALTAVPINPDPVTPGSPAQSIVTVTPVHGYAGSIGLVCSAFSGGSPPPGCAFAPASLTISGANAATSVLTVSTLPGTPPGNYSISVTGSDAGSQGPGNGPQVLSLTVLPAGAFGYALTAGPPVPAQVTSGGTSVATVTLTSAGGYAGIVNLSCAMSSGAAAPGCVFIPASVTVSGTGPVTSALTITTSTTTPAGNYNVVVTASDTASAAPINGSVSLPLTTASPIQHVVIIFQENRTPDNLFQDPVLIARGADIASSGVNSLGQSVPLLPIDLGTEGASPQLYDLGHTHADFVAEFDGGAMDGADLVGCEPASDCAANAAFRYVLASDVQPYFAMAEQYTFGDRMFQTNQGPSFPAHQFIISGTSAPAAASPLFAAENPTNGVGGCVAAPLTLVSMIDATGSETNPAPWYPCFDHPTLTDLLDESNISWRYYAISDDSIWNGPAAIEHICQQQTSARGAISCAGPDWIQNVVIPQTQVLADIANGRLAQVAWVTPNAFSSDHASVNDGSGPSWVASIVNAIGGSAYWPNTAIIITWDDWGGWFDHVAPQVIDDGISWGSGYVYGLRVPLIVVSPYARPAYVSHVTHDFGSILKFVEANFNLPSLGYADTPADDLSDCFDLTQTPTPFQAVPAALGAQHFINDRRPSAGPDND